MKFHNNSHNYRSKKSNRYCIIIAFIYIIFLYSVISFIYCALTYKKLNKIYEECKIKKCESNLKNTKIKNYKISDIDFDRKNIGPPKIKKYSKNSNKSEIEALKSKIVSNKIKKNPKIRYQDSDISKEKILVEAEIKKEINLESNEKNKDTIQDLNIRNETNDKILVKSENEMNLESKDSTNFVSKLDVYIPEPVKSDNNFKETGTIINNQNDKPLHKYKKLQRIENNKDIYNYIEDYNISDKNDKFSPETSSLNCKNHKFLRNLEEIEPNFKPNQSLQIQNEVNDKSIFTADVFNETAIKKDIRIPIFDSKIKFTPKNNKDLEIYKFTSDRKNDDFKNIDLQKKFMLKLKKNKLKKSNPFKIYENYKKSNFYNKTNIIGEAGDLKLETSKKSKLPILQRNNFHKK